MTSPISNATLPSGWKRSPLKHMVSTPITDGPHLTPEFHQTGIPFVSAEAVWDGQIHLESVRGYISEEDDALFSRKYSPQPDDIYIVKSGATTGKVAINRIEGRFNIWSPLAAIRCDRREAHPQFVFHAISSKYFQEAIQVSWSIGTQPNIGMEVIENLRVLLPPLETQRRIAAYLDRETGRIDTLIAAKERLLALLAEKRQALITHAVTRGLNLHAPLRDSGLPWLGKIPEHWSVHRLKFHMPRIEQGWSPQCDNFPANDDEWGVLKVGAVNGWKFNPNENKRLPADLEPLLEYEIREGDVLTSRANTTQLVGRAALVRNVRPKLLFCDKHYRLTLDRSALSPEFLVLYLRSTAGHYEFERDATGASNSMQNIGQDSVQNVWITVPPLSEQRDIVGYVNITTTRMDAMESANRRTLELLRERRSALIAAAVTGQLEVEA